MSQTLPRRKKTHQEKNPSTPLLYLILLSHVDLRYCNQWHSGSADSWRWRGVHTILWNQIKNNCKYWCRWVFFLRGKVCDIWELSHKDSYVGYIPIPSQKIRPTNGKLVVSRSRALLFYRPPSSLSPWPPTCPTSTPSSGGSGGIHLVYHGVSCSLGPRLPTAASRVSRYICGRCY